MLLNEPAGRSHHLDWSHAIARVSGVALPVFFLSYSAGLTAVFVARGYVGIDARIYAEAARAWISGADPWAASVDGFFFAAPPPTLLAFAPFAILGPSLCAAIWVGGSAAAAVLVIRRLGLSWWWVFFPPITNGVLAGNPDVIIVAFVLTRSGLFGAAATMLKIYALVPIVGERQWRAAAVSVIALIATVPLLPWGEYLSRAGAIAAMLDAQAAGMSAFGTPWLMALVVLGLVVLGPQLAGWLAVPALWPSTQLHYSALALPALSRVKHPLTLLIASLLLSSEIVWGPPAAVLVLATAAVVGRVRATRSVAPSMDRPPAV
jgi:hypothetical protein